MRVVNKDREHGETQLSVRHVTDVPYASFFKDRPCSVDLKQHMSYLESATLYGGVPLNDIDSWLPVQEMRQVSGDNLSNDKNSDNDR